jgi:competence protein ComGC
MAHNRGAGAFTRKELVVVIVIIAVIVALLVPALRRANQKSMRLCCVCNLKQIGTAYRIWENDHGDLNPVSAPVTNGGWNDFLSRTNGSTYSWMNFAAMANELGESPVILVCPADERKPAEDMSNFLSNANLSYFTGVDASDSFPQALLGGDRNLGSGTVPDSQYGYSPADGRGNDVVIKGPVCWSLKMHSRGDPAGSGNILLGDGSARQATSANLNQNWLKAAIDTSTNSAGIRLIFP